MSAAATAAPAANAPRAAAAPPTRTMAERAAAASASMVATAKSLGASGWVALLMSIIGVGFLIANVGYMANLAGSSDAWDSVKTQMGGAAAMAFIGALAFMAALILYFRAFNADLPVYIVTVISCLAIAISLTALSVASITR